MGYFVALNLNEIPYTTKFSLAKIFTKDSHFVLGQNFNFANRAGYFPGSGWSSRLIGMHVLCTYARALMQIQCVKFFTMQKNCEKFLAKIGENFHMQVFNNH